MADLEIGYNVGKAKDLMESVKTQFESLKSTISDGWTDVQSTLHTEWIGQDEISFEAKFAERVNDLYKDAATLATNCCGVVADLVNGWSNFQANNILNDAQAGTATTIEALTFSADEVISAQAEDIDESTDLGLKSSGSAETIQTSVSEYVSSIQTQAQNLFEEIKSNEAFFGDQTTTIDSYISSCGVAIGEVVTAVQDLHTALTELANSQYNKNVENITEAVTNEESNVNKIGDELGAAKWNGGA